MLLYLQLPKGSRLTSIVLLYYSGGCVLAESKRLLICFMIHRYVFTAVFYLQNNFRAAGNINKTDYFHVKYVFFEYFSCIHYSFCLGLWICYLFYIHTAML